MAVIIANTESYVISFKCLAMSEKKAVVGLLWPATDHGYCSRGIYGVLTGAVSSKAGETDAEVAQSADVFPVLCVDVQSWALGTLSFQLMPRMRRRHCMRILFNFCTCLA